jgi:malate dehydrogenase (oxaloacetate-decarboxylating)
MDSPQIFEYHRKHLGKISINTVSPIKDKSDLSKAYTPGVAKVSEEIYKNPASVYEFTIKGHAIAVITDGSAVLGLGNIGAEAAIPVMEGKAALFKTFAGLDAFPICLATQNTKEIINIVKNISPVFGGINLEDIAAPRCFEIEENLQDLGIPVMHDDQHGTAVVVLAGLINATKVAGKNMADLRIVVNGAGAAGNAITKLIADKVKDVVILDSRGIISGKRKDLDKYKKRLLKITNKNNINGSLREALIDSDVFIGVSKGNLLTKKDIKLMAGNSIIFALANPIPEIMPEEAIAGGALVTATGRSDLPNQINNSLAFPGIFKGALHVKAQKITLDMKLRAAEALSKLVKKPTASKIIPGPFDKGVAKAVASAVISAYKDESNNKKSKLSKKPF